MPRFRAINSSALQLEWDVPFTWEYTSIDHYKISVNNSMDNWNRSSWKDTSLLFMSSGGRSECRQYTFTVLANNGLSDGDPGRVSGGFPIGKSRFFKVLIGSVCSGFNKPVWF